MPSKYCCVPKCYNKDGKCYRITEIKEAQKIWIERIGNPDLANLRIASNAIICRKHFHADCINIDGKLKKFALPTLHLPEYVNSHRNDDLFLYSPNESNPELSRKMQDSIKPSTLLDEVQELKVHVPKRVYTRGVIAGPSRHAEDVLTHIPLLINQFDLREENKNNINIAEIRALFCSNHQNIGNKFVNFSLKFIIYFYERTVNKILCGKKSIRFNDPIMQLAAEKFNKKRRK